MCEYVSFVCTTDGPLAIYAAPGLSSHGDARAGWKLKGGAEAEWTGENHDSLIVRYEDKAMADTVKAMIVEKFPNRTALINSITEVRGINGTQFMRNGRRIFTEAEAGPEFDALNELLEKLPTLPYLRPTEECCDAILDQLVAEHLYLLGTYCKDAHQFDGVTLKIVRDPAARAAAWDAAWDAARAAAWDAARAAARDAAWDAAWAAAWAAAWDAARAAAWDAALDAARAAARDAQHLVSGLPNNPWAPLVEIWALGAVPIGIVDGEFVVYVPETSR